MSTVTAMPTAGLQAGPGSPIFCQVETTTDAPLFRNKEASKKKRFSLKKMMSKVKSSKRILNFSKSASEHSNDDAIEPTKLAYDAAAAPLLEMVVTDDEISSSSSNSEREHNVAVHEEVHKESVSPEIIESSSSAAEPLENAKFLEEQGTSEGEKQDNTICYELDDEEYVEEKEPEKTPCTSSDVVALLLAGALMAAQALR